MEQEHISLNKYISETGLCSRREADKLIEAGRVKINDVIARKGNRATATDKVYIDDVLISKETKPVYIALNKPVGIVCTTDQREPDNIIDYLGFQDRIFPIGRLDKMSQGLILLTNDGDIVNKILRAGNYHEKEYIVTVNKPIDSSFIKSMSAGVPILDTVTNPCKVTQIDEFTFKIILTQGLNRQIRRMCEYLDYHVRSLNRVRIMNISLEGIPYDTWRYLTEKEISELMDLVKDSRK
ncbi:MAG TPA: 23S rRNA pseudouridine(2604) synthase RluF [Saprospiraceae bacterium]|nr:23S rRNA pseudouridine(2604) synthase RluF [Saprospiraceae bacterium]HMU03570.1 23S rRNA pseudouridine(2604) synthase RluF [Saprospiraceae bacterium]